MHIQKQASKMNKSPTQKRQKTLADFFVSNSEESSSAATCSRPIDSSRPSTTVEHDPDSSSSTAALEQRSPGIALALTVELDIANFIPHSNVDDQTKYDYLTNHWKPESTYKFPRVARKVKGKTVYLSFQQEWLQTFKWLACSPSQNGAFCKYCRIFASEGGGGSHLKTFVKTPMCNLKDAKADMAEHSKRAYHLTAQLQAEALFKLI